MADRSIELRAKLRGVLAGSWSAMAGMLMAVTYGFSQFFWGRPRLEQRNVGSPDFLRSD